MPKTHFPQINGEISPFYGIVKNPNVVSSQLDDSNGEYEFVLRENSGERSRVRQKKSGAHTVECRRRFVLGFDCGERAGEDDAGDGAGSGDDVVDGGLPGGSLPPRECLFS